MDKKSIDEIVKISFGNPLKFSVAKNTIKKTLGFQLMKIDSTLPPLEDKKLHNFSLTEKKRPKNVTEPIETEIIRGQQKFNLHNVLNPVQVEVTDNKTLIITDNKTSYKTLPLSDLLRFSINLIDNKNQQIEFNSGEQKQKISILNFKIGVFLR